MGRFLANQAGIKTCARARVERDERTSRVRTARRCDDRTSPRRSRRRRTRCAAVASSAPVLALLHCSHRVPSLAGGSSKGRSQKVGCSVQCQHGDPGLSALLAANDSRGRAPLVDRIWPTAVHPPPERGPRVQGLHHPHGQPPAPRGQADRAARGVDHPRRGSQRRGRAARPLGQDDGRHPYEYLHGARGHARPEGARAAFERQERQRGRGLCDGVRVLRGGVRPLRARRHGRVSC